MDTLLVVEDDKLMRHIMRETLCQNEFTVLEAAHGKRLKEILDEHSVDLILLDLHLPDCSGIELLSAIRARTNAPVIIVSGDEDNKHMTLEGLGEGADDYIKKPFDPDILIARIKANLRRYKSIQANQNVKPYNSAPDKVAFGSWVFDRMKFQIFDEEKRSGNLSACEFRLLDVLISNAGRAVKRDELCEAIREDNYIPTSRAIDVKITRIRKKIGDCADDQDMIQTMRGVGYMFDANKIKKDILR